MKNRNYYMLSIDNSPKRWIVNDETRKNRIEKLLNGNIDDICFKHGGHYCYTNGREERVFVRKLTKKEYKEYKSDFYCLHNFDC